MNVSKWQEFHEAAWLYVLVFLVLHVFLMECAVNATTSQPNSHSDNSYYMKHIKNVYEDNDATTFLQIGISQNSSVYLFFSKVAVSESMIVNNEGLSLESTIWKLEEFKNVKNIQENEQ